MPKFAGVLSSQRIFIQSGDLSGRVLTDAALVQVCQRIQQDHLRAISSRRYFLRQAMVKALLRVRAGIPRSDLDGFIRIESPTNAQKYGIRITPRPPELTDFQTVAGIKLQGEKLVVVGPRVALEPLRRQSLDWLANKTSIPLFDEGRMLTLARQIEKGTL